MPKWTLIAIATILIIVIVAGGYVGVTYLGSNQPSPSPTLNPTSSPSSSPSSEPLITIQAQVRNDAMSFIGQEHQETFPLMDSLSWTGGEEQTGLLGASKFLYTSGNWTVEMSYPVIPNPIYTIGVNYTQNLDVVSWLGTSENGTIAETSYSTTLPIYLSNQAQVREIVVAYLKSNHTELAPLLQNISWTGGRVTPAGLVGAETYTYDGGNWTIKIEYPVYYDIIYNITAIYLTNSITAPLASWQGTVHNGNVTETMYSYVP